jgi:DNA-binding response OmpR family regulator
VERTENKNDELIELESDADELLEGEGEGKNAFAVAERADVLVIDDTALGRNSVVRLLRRAGIAVIATDTAIGATRLVLRSRVSVVVADLNMPAMQGSALLRLVRSNPRLAHVALVLLSGVGAQELVTAAREVEADAAISKLEMATTLVPTVNRLLRRAHRPTHVSGKFSLLPSILTKKSTGSEL